MKCGTYPSVQRAAVSRPLNRLVDYFFAALSDSIEDVYVRSGEIEAIKVHHLGPGGHEVLDKLLL